MTLSNVLRTEIHQGAAPSSKGLRGVLIQMGKLTAGSEQRGACKQLLLLALLLQAPAVP